MTIAELIKNDDSEKELISRIPKSESYDEALRIMMEYIEIE